MATLAEALALALQHHQSGRLSEAEEIYRQILDIEPNQVDALHLLGVLEEQIDKHDQAIGHMRRAIALNGGEWLIHFNLGNALKTRGKLSEAEACFRKVLQLRPDFFEALHNLGMCLYDQGKFSEAADCFRRCLELKPDDVAVHNNLGNAWKETGRLDEAVACYHRALQLNPDFADAHNNLGSAFQLQGKLDEAMNCWRRALRINPDLAVAHGNLGTAYYSQGKLDEALASCRSALRLQPEHPAAHVNLGVVLRAQGRIDESFASYCRALELKPDDTEAHFHLADARLIAGDWERGWLEYEWRWRKNGLPPRPFPQPVWDGKPLAGRTILLHAEQGLGDTIQFIRYVPLVTARGGRVVLECQPPLVPLLSRLSGVDQIVAAGTALPKFDTYAPLLSLPRIFETTPQTVPAQVPYLFADSDVQRQWRAELSRCPGFKVGIAWQGKPSYLRDRWRSVPLRYFEPLARVPGVRLVSLQRGPGTEQLAAVRDQFEVLDWSDRLDVTSGPFLDTAALVASLDLVVCVDSAVAHLAGALAAPVWLATSFACDWRWLLAREDSPWYPTMRLFRQTAPDDWDGVFERMAVALRELAASSQVE